MNKKEIDWLFDFWLFGIQVYTAWGFPKMVIEAEANAIGFASRD